MRRSAAPIVLTVSLALALLVAFGACRRDTSTPERRVDSRDREDPLSLDPARATDVPSGRAVASLFDDLREPRRTNRTDCETGYRTDCDIGYQTDCDIGYQTDYDIGNGIPDDG